MNKRNHAVSAFATYINSFRIPRAHISKNLNFYIREWLAHPTRYSFYSFETMWLHEQYWFIKHIEFETYKRWSKKRAEQRAAAQRRSEQQRLLCKPRNDPRNYILI